MAKKNKRMNQGSGENRCTDSVIEHLQNEINELKRIHQLDMAEIVRLRRMVQAVEEGRI